jgi:hypothetical protein
LAGLIAFAGQATALTDAQKCEVTKLKRAGQYNFCRLKAEGKAVKTGDPVDYTKCDLKFSTKWADAEGIPMCPTTGDSATMQARVTADADDVAACLSGTCPPSCGDGTANGVESCDGVDLAGETCITLGFASGTLTCTAGCGFDISACNPPSSSVPATGQTTSYGPGSDGAVQAGAPLSYTDNGDGTITDNNTGLTWEKKSDDDSIHDVHNKYTWGMTSPPYTMNGTMVTTFLDTLNDVGGGGASCFAGHCDWRIPNRNELHSIVHSETSSPAVSAAFNTACAPACTVLTCSCTLSSNYWTSTTFAIPDLAWFVYFDYGYDGADSKTHLFFVRAVRGGS